MFSEIHDVLIKSKLINNKDCAIDFYDYPNLDEFEGIYIIIDPLAPPKPTDYVEDTWLAEEYFYQIDVWSKSYEDTSSVANEVQRVIFKELGFTQTGSGLDEKDEKTGIFRDARRYIGKKYLL
ncbi:hypothetical protein [Priestia megaterium]|uniref:hypothetical protein n=1 Tax=Priestia megaterium TaxID=1404 RepID=UPI000BFB4686|nr:hypothetical protein [Priestia megaterium]PGR01348.1 hypothetical protein COA23_23140 [Priestia megaterium]